MPHYPSDPFRRSAANRDPEEEALGWIVRLTSGDVTNEDHSQFDAWRDDRENAQAYDRAALLWRGLGPILERQQALGWPGAHDPDASTPLRQPAASPLKRRRRYRLIALAASLVLTIGTATEYVQVWQYDHVSGSTIKDALKLADGSGVTMGPGTAFKTDFTNRGRHVLLARGEAYFDVVHDSAHPFVVSSGNGMVRVLGTAFSVRKVHDSSVTVTVTRGQVQVTSGANNATLTPNREVTFDRNGFGTVRAVNASTTLAWMRGRLIMEDRPLGDVVRELDRYRPGMTLLLNDEASQRRINAVIDLGQTDSWLTAMASSQGLAVTRFGSLTIMH